MRAREFVQRAEQQLNRLRGAEGELRTARKAHEQTVSTLETARNTALDELTASLLPELTPQALDRVKTEAGYGRFAQDDPFAYMERRRAELEGRIRAIESDERYVRRRELLDPVTGELTLKHDQLANDLGILREPLERYERDSRFMDLVRCGYDTEAYTPSIFTIRYYSDWKWGDVFCELFGHERFTEVREAYFNLRHAFDAQQRDLEALRAEMNAVTALEQEHDDSGRKLSTIREDTLASCRSMLREHLEHIDRNELARWMAADPTRVAVVKRLHGIERKADYLGTMASRQFLSEGETLGRAIDKLRRKHAKYQRPKNANASIPLAEARTWLGDPLKKVHERRERFGRDYDRVERFDRYDAFDYANNILWWDLMTDGRIDGDFIPEVNAWRASHAESVAPPERDLSRASTAYSAVPPDQDSDLLEVS